MDLDKFVVNVAGRSVQKGLINENQSGIYSYGLYLVFTSALSFLCSLVWGIAFHCLPEVMVFLLFFIPIRMHTGGYHASTYPRCLAMTLLMLLALQGILLSIPAGWDMGYAGIVSLIALSCIFGLAPVSHPNAPIRERDRGRLRRTGRIIGILEIAMIVLGSRIVADSGPLRLLPLSAATGLLVASLLIVFGRLARYGKEVETK